MNSIFLGALGGAEIFILLIIIGLIVAAFRIGYYWNKPKKK